MGQTMERMKEGYSKIRNEALAHAFAYMNLIEHWGSGIPRIMDKVKAWSTSRLKCSLMKMVSLLFRMIIN
nr:ATP-binding protein [Lachnotalea sp. AF33-28]